MNWESTRQSVFPFQTSSSWIEKYRIRVQELPARTTCLPNLSYLVKILLRSSPSDIKFTLLHWNLSLPTIAVGNYINQPHSYSYFSHRWIVTHHVRDTYRRERDSADFSTVCLNWNHWKGKMKNVANVPGTCGLSVTVCVWRSEHNFGLSRWNSSGAVERRLKEHQIRPSTTDRNIVSGRMWVSARLAESSFFECWSQASHFNFQLLQYFYQFDNDVNNDVWCMLMMHSHCAVYMCQSWFIRFHLIIRWWVKTNWC